MAKPSKTASFFTQRRFILTELVRSVPSRNHQLLIVRHPVADRIRVPLIPANHAERLEVNTRTRVARFVAFLSLRMCHCAPLEDPGLQSAQSLRTNRVVEQENIPADLSHAASVCVDDVVPSLLADRLAGCILVPVVLATEHVKNGLCANFLLVAHERAQVGLERVFRGPQLAEAR
eukprot:7387214-Prymnesium_polylepis.2